jgi:hypothetical protein
VIKVSIRADTWAVSATAHDNIENPFNGRNVDVIVADAIRTALDLAAPGLWNPLYVLATCVMNLDRSVSLWGEEAAKKFEEAAIKYVSAIEDSLTNNSN